MDCVILAAGKSERMGSWKMLLPFRGATILEATAEKTRSVCSRLIVVCGYRSEEVRALFSADKRVHVVVNPDYEKGMFSSIQTGCSYVESDSFFLVLGDMPLVLEKTYEKLLSYAKAGVVIPKFNGKKGHPIILTKDHARMIIKASREESLRDILLETPTLLVPVDDSGVIKDIDTRKDYKAVTSKYEK